MLTGNNNARADFLRLQAVIHLQLGHIRLAQGVARQSRNAAHGIVSSLRLAARAPAWRCAKPRLREFDPGRAQNKLLDAAETFLKAGPHLLTGGRRWL